MDRVYHRKLPDQLLIFVDGNVVNVYQDLIQGYIIICPHAKLIGHRIDQHRVHTLILDMELFLFVVDSIEQIFDIRNGGDIRFEVIKQASVKKLALIVLHFVKDGFDLL